MADPVLTAQVLELFARSLSAATPPAGSGAPSAADSTSNALAAAADMLKNATPGTAGEVAQQIFSHLQAHAGPARDAAADPPGEAPISPLRRAYRLSASVLTALDPQRLRPLGMEPDPERVVGELVEDLVEVYDPPSPTVRWMLRPDLREKVLRECGRREELLAALAANPERPRTLLQSTLEAYIRSEDPGFALEELDAPRLTAVLQAVRWLQPTKLLLPAPEKVQEIIDRNQVPALFETMAGENFTGREGELKLLRNYVEVLDPDSTYESLRRQFRRWLSLRSKPPLVVFGPGGSGKTTLISKFLLDHSRVPEELKFPYVYLDFDNPRLSLRDPNTILDEAVRQLSAQYPEARGALRDFLDLERKLSRRPAKPLRAGEVLGKKEGRPAAAEGGSTSRAADVGDAFDVLDQSQARQEVRATGSASRFADLVGRIIRREKYSLPLLLVFDTYEEVQRRGVDQELRLWDLVDSIQKQFETLRVVVFGRAALDRVPTTGVETTQVPLDAFDAEAAVSFLKKLGVKSHSDAQKVYGLVGGNPLSLKLASEVYRRESGSTGGLVKNSRTFFIFSAGEGLIQGQLYQRILGHIKDPDVRRLAHPGLMLRRITPDVIRLVLQGPCGVPVPDDARARELFESLASEGALVTREPDGSLRHRADVRRIMLKLLEADKPDLTAEINRLAVEYYRGQEGAAARAEEIYHRLQLCQPPAEVESRWMPGVEDYLGGALEELPAQSKAILATHLGVRLTEKEAVAADTAAWERYAARQADEMLKLGHNSEALKLLGQRRQRTPGSPLYLIEAKAYALAENKKAAVKAVEKALQAAAETGDREERLEALLLAAQLAQDGKMLSEADEYLRQAAKVSAALGNTVRQIFATGVRVLLRAGRQKSAPAPDPGLRPELARLVGSLPDEVWVEHKELLRATVSLLGLDYPDLVLKMLRHIGLGTLTRWQISILSKAVKKCLESSPEARRVHATFAKTAGQAESLSELGLLSALHYVGRLDEYVEMLVLIALKNPGLAEELSKALARTRLRSRLNAEEEDTA